MKIVFLILLNIFSAPSFACSAFCLSGQDKVIVGKSYDWFFGHGHGAVYTNPRGTSRQTILFDQSPNPAQWVSKFGSVIFTQFGRAVPISGMNEKGLVVELLQSHTAVYNSAQIEKPYVNESQWAQYQLDNFSSVEEVVAHIEELRIERAYTGIHYFIADRDGHSATVDFVDGKLDVRTGKTMPVPVLTNDTYAELLDYDATHTGPPTASLFGRSSEVRFQRAKAMTDELVATPDSDLSKLAWKTLATVRLNGFTRDALAERSQWNIVYDLKEGKIVFRTRDSNTLKELDLHKIDFSVGAGEQMADMNLPVAGDFAPYLHPYSFAENEALIRKNTLLFTLSGQRAKIPFAVEYGRTCEKLLD